MKRIKFYTDQGVTPLPGYDTFFIGNISTTINYKKVKKKSAGK